MRILVTGGAGFIGSALVRHLVDDERATVLNVDKLTYAACRASLDAVARSPNYHFIQADIADAGAMAVALSDFAPEAVVHLAAESHVDRSISGASAFINTNIVGTYTLLEAVRGHWSKLPKSQRSVFRFLHVSTDEVFGSLGAEGLFGEETRYDPSSPYAASKAASDHLVMAWHRTYGLPTIISNCSNNYGPYQFPEKLIPLMVLNAREGRALPIYGNGLNVRDWLYVDDHARALVTVLRHGRIGESYNVGGRNEQTNLAVVERICDLMDVYNPSGSPHRSLMTFVADRPGHDHRYAIDAGKLETELGWRARETFETGLDKTVNWYMTNETWWAPLRRDVYSGGRLGLVADAPQNAVGGAS